MASVNKVIIVGNLGADPELKTFDNGGKIATISVATTDRWTDRNTGEQREATEWHRIVFNDRLAEIVTQYLRKGSSIYVEGSLKTRKWQDPQTGQDRYSTEIRATSMQMLGGRQNNDSYGGGYGIPQTPNQSPYNNQPNYNNRPQAQASNQPINNGYNPMNGGNAPMNNGYQQNTQPPMPSHNPMPQNSMPQNPMGAMDNGYNQPAPTQNNNQFGNPSVSPAMNAPTGNAPINNAPAGNAPADDDMPF